MSLSYTWTFRSEWHWLPCTAWSAFEHIDRGNAMLSSPVHSPLLRIFCSHIQDARERVGGTSFTMVTLWSFQYPSDAEVQFWTVVRTGLFMNWTVVRFNIRSMGWTGPMVRFSIQHSLNTLNAFERVRTFLNAVVKLANQIRPHSATEFGLLLLGYQPKFCWIEPTRPSKCLI